MLSLAIRWVSRRRTARWMAWIPQAIRHIDIMITGRLKSTIKIPSCQALASQASLTLATVIASASDNRGYCSNCRDLGTPRQSIVTFPQQTSLYHCFPRRRLSPKRPSPHRGTVPELGLLGVQFNKSSYSRSARDAQHLTASSASAVIL